LGFYGSNLLTLNHGYRIDFILLFTCLICEVAAYS